MNISVCIFTEGFAMGTGVRVSRGSLRHGVQEEHVPGPGFKMNSFGHWALRVIYIYIYIEEQIYLYKKNIFLGSCVLPSSSIAWKRTNIL